MTEPTTVFDLSPDKVVKLRRELASIERRLAKLNIYGPGPAERASLTRRRDRIIAALDTVTNPVRGETHGPR